MVVIEGPRFSTRAESRSYADEGWTLVNMTGTPEAALARELRMCYSAIALVTDMDAGAESGEGVGQEEVFALFRAEPRAAHRAPDPHHRGTAVTRRVLVRHLGRRRRADLRTEVPVKVLLTGSAGFIGGAIGRALDEAGDEVVRVDLMLDKAHGSAAAPEGTHQVDVRDADRLGAPAPRRRRRLPPGRGGRRRRHGRRPAGVRRPQRPRHRRPARHDARGRRRPAGAGLVDGRLRRGPLRVRRARRPGACRRGPSPPWTPATSTTTARSAAPR